MKKKTIIILSSVAGILIVLALVFSSGEEEGISITTEKAQVRTITEMVSANGKIQPEVEVKLSPDVSGEIVELLVKEGQQVKKGDLLAKIKPDIYVSMVDRMEASLNTSRSNLSNSKARLAQVKAQFVNTEASFERSKKLFDQGAISQSEFDAAKAGYEGARADMEATEENVRAAEFGISSSMASLKEARDNLVKTTIFAPVSGTISKLSVELGERVVGTTQMAGTELLRIANLNEMEVSVDVNESDIVRVHVNDTSLIEVDAFLNRKFKGIVTEIANSANITGLSADQVTNFTVKIRILQESYKDLISDKNPNVSPFRPGMSATVDIKTKTEKNVISVPIQSVTTRSGDLLDKTGKEENKTAEQGEDDGGDITVTDEKQKEPKEEKEKPQEVIFLFDNGKAKLVKVKTGIQDDNYIQVLEGIKVGNEVISGPYQAVSKTLKDKKEVKKVDKDKLFATDSKK